MSESGNEGTMQPHESNAVWLVWGERPTDDLPVLISVHRSKQGALEKELRVMRDGVRGRRDWESAWVSPWETQP